MAADRYVRIPTRLIEAVRDGKVSATALHAYMAIALHANDSGIAHPSLQRIANNMRKSRDTARRAVRELAETGWIGRQRQFIDGRETSTSYWLQGFPVVNPDVDHQRGAPMHPLGTDAPHGGCTGAPRTSSWGTRVVHADSTPW